MAAIFLVTSLQGILCRPKAETPALTPFSAVVPPRFIAVPRHNTTLVTLETILEEENEEDVGMDVSQNSSPSSTLLSPCFFQVKKPLPLFSHNCKCA
ncbi:hypothetical protein V6N13_092984 [Hibiscus sabdariffa]|uniref:Secreted protein n=2 Tax=Hibiscus sabdariffa TaxID=183260 RepID=A0ABR2APW5_9ROSI